MFVVELTNKKTGEKKWLDGQFKLHDTLDDECKFEDWYDANNLWFNYFNDNPSYTKDYYTSVVQY